MRQKNVISTHCLNTCMTQQGKPQNTSISMAGSGFSGLEVSVLAFGTRVRGFKPGRSRRIFRAKKSSARLPSEGK